MSWLYLPVIPLYILMYNWHLISEWIEQNDVLIVLGLMFLVWLIIH